MRLLGKSVGATVITALAITAVPAHAGLFKALEKGLEAVLGDPDNSPAWQASQAEEARRKRVADEWNAKVLQEMKDGTSPFLHAGEPMSEGALEMRLYKLETGFYDPD